MHQDSPSPVAEITSSKRFANASNAALVSAAFAPPSLASPKATLRASKSRMASSERWDPLDLLGWGFSIRTQPKKNSWQTGDKNSWQDATNNLFMKIRDRIFWEKCMQNGGNRWHLQVIAGELNQLTKVQQKLLISVESYLLIPQCLIKPGCFWET